MSEPLSELFSDLFSDPFGSSSGSKHGGWSDSPAAGGGLIQFDFRMLP